MASGSVVEHRALSFLPGLLLGLQFRQPLQRRPDPLGPLPGRPLPGPPLAAIRGRRVFFHLRPQGLDLRLGLRQGFFQGRSAAERRGPGRGADPHPVLGDPVQIDQTLGHQRGDALGQEVVEQFAMVGAEVGEGVVVGGHVAGDPLEGGVVPAEPVQLPGAADPLDGGVEPQRHEDLGVDGGTSGPPFDGLDAVVQGAEVEPLDVVPDDAGGMVAGDQGVERRGAEDDLLTVGRPEPRPPPPRVGGLGGRTRRSPRRAWGLVPSHRTPGVVDLESFQFGRERPRGRVDRYDADLDPFVRGRVDPRKPDPSAAVVAVPGRELLALAPEPEEEVTVCDRDPVRHGQATALAQLEVEVGVRPLPETGEPFRARSGGRPGH